MICSRRWPERSLPSRHTSDASVANQRPRNNVMTRLLIGVVVLLGSIGLSAQAPANCDAIGNVQFICGQNGPEDLVVVPGAQWVVASSYGGSGGVMLIRVSARMSSVAYPGAAPKERLDAKTHN